MESSAYFQHHRHNKFVVGCHGTNTGVRVGRVAVAGALRVSASAWFLFCLLPCAQTHKHPHTHTRLKYLCVCLYWTGGGEAHEEHNVLLRPCPVFAVIEWMGCVHASRVARRAHSGRRHGASVLRLRKWNGVSENRSAPIRGTVFLGVCEWVYVYVCVVMTPWYWVTVASSTRLHADDARSVASVCECQPLLKRLFVRFLRPRSARVHVLYFHAPAHTHTSSSRALRTGHSTFC